MKKSKKDVFESDAITNIFKKYVKTKMNLIYKYLEKNPEQLIKFMDYIENFITENDKINENPIKRGLSRASKIDASSINLRGPGVIDSSSINFRDPGVIDSSSINLKSQDDLNNKIFNTLEKINVEPCDIYQVRNNDIMWSSNKLSKNYFDDKECLDSYENIKEVFKEINLYDDKIDTALTYLNLDDLNIDMYTKDKLIKWKIEAKCEEPKVGPKKDAGKNTEKQHEHIVKCIDEKIPFGQVFTRDFIDESMERTDNDIELMNEYMKVQNKKCDDMFFNEIETRKNFDKCLYNCHMLNTSYKNFGSVEDEDEDFLSETDSDYVTREICVCNSDYCNYCYETRKYKNKMRIVKIPRFLSKTVLTELYKIKYDVLIFDEFFNDSVDGLNICENVVYIEFGNSFNKSLKNFDIKNVKKIKFGDCFNNELPNFKTLYEIEFGINFERSLFYTRLTSTVNTVKFPAKSKFLGSLFKNMENIKVLELGNLFNYGLSPFKLPKHLEYVKISGHIYNINVIQSFNNNLKCLEITEQLMYPIVLPANLNTLVLNILSLTELDFLYHKNLKLIRVSNIEHKNSIKTHAKIVDFDCVRLC